MKRSIKSLPGRITALVVLLLIPAFACGGDDAHKVLFIGGIPDQDVSILESRFSSLAEYLSEATGLDVRYVPSVNYAAVVTGFRHNDIQMAWYGGLTGVQARLAVPDARALAQRPRDAQFHSVFIARKSLGITSLEQLKGRSFTFGSESSTSGYLMPLHFLIEAGIDPDRDFSGFSFSGSHDATWKLVEAGTVDAGALNAAVWEMREADGRVDLGRVEVFWKTPAYFDYHWLVRGDLDAEYGSGTTERLRDALFGLNAASGGRQAEIMLAFQDDRFIPSTNENYDAIENVARRLGIIEQ